MVACWVCMLEGPRAVCVRVCVSIYTCVRLGVRKQAALPTHLEEEVEADGGEGHEDVEVEEEGRPGRRLVLWCHGCFWWVGGWVDGKLVLCACV